MSELLSLGCQIFKNEPLSNRASFKIGGPADFLIEVPNYLALEKIYERLSNENIFILGAGTNILFSDEGFRGVVLKLSQEFKEFVFEGEKLFCGAAASLPLIVKSAAQKGLSGLQCLAGIPGTVGGAVFGNAGSANIWISQCIESVEIFRDFRREIIKSSEINFEYRKSSIDAIITKINFSLKKDAKNDILAAISQSIENRKKTQPIDKPSAGCVFKNPKGLSAGKLIDEAGLKGVSIGGAQISDLHGNFIINKDKAGFNDILALIELIKRTVKKKFNADLELEIRIIQ